jgi:hypothetical protein
LRKLTEFPSSFNLKHPAGHLNDEFILRGTFVKREQSRVVNMPLVDAYRRDRQGGEKEK